MADYYQVPRSHRGPADNNNGYAMPPQQLADYQGLQPQNKLIDIIDTYQMQPRQGQGLGTSRSTNVLNNYISSMNDNRNYQSPNMSPSQDYSSYPSNPMPSGYNSVDYNGSQSYRTPQEILSKKVIQPDDLRSHPGYNNINQMRNPMYANHNYVRQQASPTSERKNNFYQDSIDALHYNMGEKSLAQIPQAGGPNNYNSVHYRGDASPSTNYNSPAGLSKAKAHDAYNEKSQNNVSQKETINYFKDEFTSPMYKNNNKTAYLSNLSSSDNNPLEYGSKLTSPLKRNVKDIYVFNPLTQTPMLRQKTDTMVKRTEMRDSARE